MKETPFSLEGKAVLVTGASSGIGRAVAVECAKMGAHIIAVGRNEARLNETMSMLAGDNHTAFQGDLTSDDAVAGLVETVAAVDGVVHCAGIVKSAPLPFISLKDTRHILDVNCLAPLALSQALIRKRKIRKGGSIVFISSISGVSVVIPGNCMYSASKTALVGVARSMALEMAGRGVRVNCILPGMVETPLIRSGTVSDEDLNRDRLRYPLKRYGQPEEVAWMAVYLLSDASAWVTGSEFKLDGGYTLA